MDAREKGPTGLRKETHIALLANRWNLNAIQLAGLFGYDAGSRQEAIGIRGHVETHSNRDVAERADLLIEIAARLDGLFPSEDYQHTWLRVVIPGLDNKTPLELMEKGSTSDLKKVLSVLGRVTG